MVPNYGQTLAWPEAFGAYWRPWPCGCARMAGVARRSRPLAQAGHRQDAPHHPVQSEQPDGSALPASTRRICQCGGCRRVVLVNENLPRRELEAPNASVWTLERVIITSGLSKAYGLRVSASAGSSVHPRGRQTWGYHDYTTIGPGTLSDRLARSLQPAMRAKILARTRRILQTNLPVITGWLDAQPSASATACPTRAIVYVRYHDAITPRHPSIVCVVEKSVLIRAATTSG